MSQITVPWIAARALFPSLPADPRQPDQHAPDSDGRCPHEIADDCGCASPDAHDEWTYYTFTERVPVRAEQTGPGKPWLAVVSLPADSRYRARVLRSVQEIRVSSLGRAPGDADPIWAAITLAIMSAADAEPAPPTTPPNGDSVEVVRRSPPRTVADRPAGWEAKKQWLASLRPGDAVAVYWDQPRQLNDLNPIAMLVELRPGGTWQTDDGAEMCARTGVFRGNAFVAEPPSRAVMDLLRRRGLVTDKPGSDALGLGGA